MTRLLETEIFNFNLVVRDMLDFPLAAQNGTMLKLQLLDDIDEEFDELLEYADMQRATSEDKVYIKAAKDTLRQTIRQAVEENQLTTDAYIGCVRSTLRDMCRHFRILCP